MFIYSIKRILTMNNNYYFSPLAFNCHRQFYNQELFISKYNACISLLLTMIIIRPTFDLGQICSCTICSNDNTSLYCHIVVDVVRRCKWIFSTCTWPICSSPIIIALEMNIANIFENIFYYIQWTSSFIEACSARVNQSRT